MLIATILLTVFLGSVIKGAVGMGVPLIATPILSMVVGVPNAVAIVTIPIFVTNFGQVLQFWSEIRQQRFLPVFLVAGVAGTVLGSAILVSVPMAWLELAVSLAVAAYLVLQLARPNLRIAPATSSRLAAPVGFVTGILQGSLGISSMASVTYLTLSGLTRSEFVGAISAIFLVFSLVQMTVLGIAGTLDLELASLGVISLAAVAVGMPIGNRLGRAMAPESFRILVLVVLVLAAVPLFVSGAGALLGLGA